MLCTWVTRTFLHRENHVLWTPLRDLFASALWRDALQRSCVTCREEELSIKLIAADDDATVDIVVQGDEEEIERMTRELDLQEKGMVYVPGVLEGLSQQK
jgi:hypothetical protein